MDEAERMLCKEREQHVERRALRHHQIGDRRKHRRGKLTKFKQSFAGNLYRIWNRMSSRSHFPIVTLCMKRAGVWAKVWFESVNCGRFVQVETPGGRASIADRMSLEDTVARAKLPKYRGFSLFDWIHPGLNVPAACNDLE